MKRKGINIKMSYDNDIGLLASMEVLRQINKWKTSAYIPLPSEWAADDRYLPAGTTEYPGKIDHSIAPHMVEIQDCFHPDSGIKCVTVMKSTQSLATTAIENVIGHAIKYKLHNILYIISSRNIAKIRSSAAIDVMIDHSGLVEYVKPISNRMKRKVADNTFYKEFSGGRRLMMTSYNSIGDAKSLSWDLIIMDELDEAPYELKGQGDPEKIFEGRGKTIRDLKIAKISTPTNAHGRINVNFLQGDQRYFYCRCPLCGEVQILVLKAMGRDYGLIAQSETIDKVEQIVPDTIRYICEYCKKEIHEYQKGDMLQGGIWKPTARPINIEYRSYQISNLMSPVMFYPWKQVMQEFCETEWGQKITKFKNFVIDVLGEPWESRSEKKSWKEVKDRAEKYKKGEIPEGGLVVTGGADVQKNRIELQLVAWGADMESWVFDYVTFFGETESKNNPVWIDFETFARSKRYKLKGITLPIALTGVDSGYNPKKETRDNDISIEHVVYEIVARNHTKMISCRGNDKIKDTILKEERVKRMSPLKRRYDVAVDELKDEIYVKLDFAPDSVGRIHFTKELGDEYFKGLLSEVYAELEPGKWGWKKIYERNEPLDTYILARAAAERLNLPTWSAQIWKEFEKRIFN
ncbi:MAG: phage terminase large subunit family protein [Methanosarcinaceae archaeon]|nr:phage terminase large subunit family protein [Methanosarcinaceae archaeon]